MNEQKPSYYDNDEIDLYDLYLKIKKRRKMILKIFFISTILSVVISLLWPKSYKSEATLIPLASSSYGELSQLAALAGISTGKQDPANKIMAVLNSDTIKEQVIKDLDLVTRLEIKISKDENPVYETARKLSKMVDVVSDKKLGIIKIEVVVKDPVLAKEIAEKYIEKLRVILSEKALTLAKANRVFLEEELNKLRKKIEQQKSLLAAFQKKEKIIEPTDQIKGAMALYAELVGKKMALEVEIRQLESILSADNPQIKSKKDLLENIKKEIAKLETTKEGAVLSIAGAPTAIKGYSDLIMDLKTSEELYKNLYALYEKARLEELKEDIFVEVIDYPKIPDIKFKPKRSLIVAITAISSLFIGIFLVFFLEFLENISSSAQTKQDNSYGS